MNLVWHIAKKDLRRLAVPALMWAAFLFGGELWFRLAAPALSGHLGAATTEWVGLVQIWKGLLELGQSLFGVLLVGTLVLEDPLPGTTSFWLTRPISGRRLLAAKALAAAVLGILVPSLVVVPIWLSIGDTFPAFTTALLDFGAQRAFIVVLGFAVGTVSRNLGQFIAGCLATWLLMIGLQLAHLAPMWVGMPRSALRLHAVTLAWTVTLALVAVTFAQAVTRRTALWRVGLIAALFIPVFATAAWRWKDRASVVSQVPMATAEEVKAIQPQSAFSVPSRNGWITSLWVKTRAASGSSFFAPVLVLTDAGMPAWSPGPQWGQTVTSLLLGQPSAAEVTWALRAAPIGRVPQDRPFTGSLLACEARLDILAELPLSTGSAAPGNQGRIRVVAIEPLDDGTNEVCLEIRKIDSSIDWQAEWWKRDPAGRRGIGAEVYLVVDRASGQVLPTGWHNEVSTRMNAQMVTYHRCRVSASAPASAVLVRAKITPVRWFRMPIHIEATPR